MVGRGKGCALKVAGGEGGMDMGAAQLLPTPCPSELVAHSPTPSTVRMAALLNGEGKKALAAWER